MVAEALRRQIWTEEMEMVEEHNKEAEVKMRRRMKMIIRMDIRTL